GIYRSVEFDEPIIANVMKDMGGWMRLCMVTNKDYPFVKKEFIARYKDYVANNKYDPNLLKLKGIEESSTVAFQSSKPVKIGSIQLTRNLKIELKDDLVTKEPEVKEEVLADDQEK